MCLQAPLTCGPCINSYLLCLAKIMHHTDLHAHREALENASILKSRPHKCIHDDCCLECPHKCTLADLPDAEHICLLLSDNALTNAMHTRFQQFCAEACVLTQVWAGSLGVCVPSMTISISALQMIHRLLATSYACCRAPEHCRWHGSRTCARIAWFRQQFAALFVFVLQVMQPTRQLLAVILRSLEKTRSWRRRQ